MDKITMHHGGYYWVCPLCDFRNDETEDSADTDVIDCGRCGEEFEVNPLVEE
jgi:hypothetical protein